MFHPEKELSTVIFNILKSEGKSISAISRELEEKGFKFHRLILTGYLRALSDMNLLKEKEVPPAKIYMPTRKRKKDIFEVIAEKAREKSGDEMTAKRIILYTLSRLFKRPVFQEELKRAGVREVEVGRIAADGEREEAKRVLNKAGFQIADSNRAYVPEESDDYREHYQDLLEAVIQERFQIGHLIRETTQTKLSL